MQLAELLAEQLQVPADQEDAFVQFARGIDVAHQMGLEVTAGQVRPATPEGILITADDSAAGGQPLPNNLPAQTTPFFGRSAELAALEEFLADPDKRLITVLGPGGMGKTRLAIAAAEGGLVDEEWGDRFTDGVYFVALAGVESAENLASSIGDALGFQFSGADEPQMQLLRYIKPRKMLLVLDNFEHLLPGVQLVQAILDTSPAIELLVTSREKLKLQSEQLLPISGLTFPPQDEALLPEQMVDYSAMQLFAERARSVRPTFDLAGENLHAAATICRLVEGMPLGIVLAAAWIDTLTVSEIMREIGRDLDFLETEMGDVPARQRSLHAAFSHSWRLLSAQEQGVYCKLSVFRGGFSPEAAADAADASLRDLQVLVNKSLLTRAPAREGKTGRYEIHELLRQFAAQELAKKRDLENGARDGHSAYFCALLQRHEAQWHSDRQLETLATISRESDNIVIAWRRAVETGAWQRLAGAIGSWGYYHHWQGLFSEGRLFCEALEKRLELISDSDRSASPACTKLWVNSLALQGVFSNITDDALEKFEAGLQFLERQDQESREIRHLKAFVLRNMAWRLIPVATHRSRRCAEQALQLSLQLEENWQAAESYIFLGLLDWHLAHLVEGRKNTEAALLILRELGDRRMQILTISVLAYIIQFEGDQALVERLRYEALDLCRQVGDRPYLIYCLRDLADALLVGGKLSESLSSAERSVALCVEYGFREKEGLAREMLANTLIHLGQYDRARTELEKGLALVQETGNQDVEANVWTRFGLLALIDLGTGREARSCFEHGRRLRKRVQVEISAGADLCGLLFDACRTGASDAARHYAVISLEHVISIRKAVQIFETLAAAAYYLAQYGDNERALKIWRLAQSHPFVAASRWYDDFVGREIEAQTAELSTAQKEAAAARASELDPWQTAEQLLADLQ